jgi:DNA-binding transcriptional LysR family regulator
LPTVKELEAFVAVMEAGSFEAAARRLNATAPAVAKRISEMESKLGVRLFERSTRRCNATLRGRALLPFAQRVLSEIGEIHRTVGEKVSLTGRIRLGVPETIAYTQLPELLRRSSVDLPNLTLDIEIGASVDLMSKVRAREIDIACVVEPVLDPNLVSEPFWEVPMLWIASGPEWKEKPLTIDALAQLTILVSARGRHIPVIEGWFKSGGVRPKQIITCNSLSTVVKMTAIGMGMSLVPIECARRELDAGLVTQVPAEMRLPTNVNVMIYPHGALEPALEAFINITRELAATLSKR